MPGLSEPPAQDNAITSLQGELTGIPPAVEVKILNQVDDLELKVAEATGQADVNEFESIMDIFDANHSERQYDWMSDISIPEFASQMLSQAAIDAGQYFQTREYTEVYIDDESDEAIACAEASKELLNRTLNQRHLHYYQKYMRARGLTNMTGRVYAVCWWEQKLKSTQTGFDVKVEELDIDEYGRPIIDSSVQVPARRTTKVPRYEDLPVIDRFNFDIVDARNVFTDNKYTYSLQDKDWITLRFEKTIDELRHDAKAMGYFGLGDLDKWNEAETDTSSKTYNKTDRKEKPKFISPYVDVIDRYGKFWCLVNQRDEYGNPTDVSPGLGEDGKPLPDAEICETIITFVSKGSYRKLVRFEANKFIDAYGVPYRPILRGLCYVHPAKDGGAGDGKYAKGLQNAIDDTINISNDRVMLATLPTLITKKFGMDDNNTVYIKPGHQIEVPNPQEDIGELRISDNIEGALRQMSLLTSKMQQVTSVYPNTMGALPEDSSVTATAIAGADQRSNSRTNLKSLTFENTFLCDLYWIIQQMTHQFAHQDTAFKLMGQKAQNFDPSKDYWYKPVSQSIESEFSKMTKTKNWVQLLGYVTQLGHPDAVKLINFCLRKIFTYMGDEYVNFADSLLDPKKPMVPPGEPNQPTAIDSGMSNQNMIPQSGMEANVRRVFSNA